MLGHDRPRPQAAVQRGLVLGVRGQLGQQRDDGRRADHRAASWAGASGLSIQPEAEATGRCVFGVERLLHARLRREPLDRQVRLRRQPLDPAQDVGDVLLLRAAPRPGSRAAVRGDRPVLELGQPACRAHALGDVRLQRGEAGLTHRDVGLEIDHVELPEAGNRARAHEHEGADLPAPRKPGQRKMHVPLLTSDSWRFRGRRRAPAP